MKFKPHPHAPTFPEPSALLALPIQVRVSLFLILWFCIALPPNPLVAAQKPLDSGKSAAVPSGNPGSWQSYSEVDLKAFINNIFVTAQDVRPELRAEALRQVADLMTSLDTSRALWVFDQAFNASQMIPMGLQSAIRQQLESQIILDESHYDLARAVEHAMRIQPYTKDANSRESLFHSKLALLMNLARQVPAKDDSGLFQRLAPEIVREDAKFQETLGLISAFERSFPDRSQQVFSEAMSQFQIQPADKTSLRNFLIATSTISSISPALASSATETLLQKADELDAASEKSSSAKYGPSHLMVISQLYPLMQKMDPLRASDWKSTLQDSTPSTNALNSSSPTVNLQSNSLTPDTTSTNSPAGRSSDSAAGPIRRRIESPPVRGGASAANPPGGSPPGMTKSDAGPTVPEPNEAMWSQPRSAFSTAISQDISKAQSASKNDPQAFSTRLQRILPQIRSEDDVRATAAAFAQISLAYYQMNDRQKGQEFLQESIHQAQEGDSALFRFSDSPTMFFNLYCATCNALARIAPQFPREAIEVLNKISDPQLRLRAMIESMRSLNTLYSVRSLAPKQ